MSRPQPTSVRRTRIAALTLGALGVVYGDIGTSPLYAMREAFRAGGGLPVVAASVLGILSLIFWSLVIVISVKYLLFVMRADNDGEGGILALLALLSPRSARGRRALLVTAGLFGTALLYGDGMITPAISVLSAVEGFAVATPALDPYVIPAAVVILVVLFAIQHRGTATVGAAFGPVMVVWFGAIGLLGLLEVAHEPSVLRAVSPLYALRFFQEDPSTALLALGSVFLVVTGGEALYADMGHFGRTPIVAGWYTLVLPGLLLNYAGQGALLLGDASAVDNPFYLLAPEWARFSLAALATVATVIASQALISGAFSLTMQAVQLDYLPRVRIRHTSMRERGQVYVAAVNWVLMGACIGLVIGFGTSARLAAAYGVAVTTTMVITTVLLFVVARERWGWSLAVAGPLAGGFLVVDLAYLVSNLFKIPNGGWFALLVGVAILTMMTTWRRGRTLVAERLRGAWVPIDAFLESIAKDPPPRVPGATVYLNREPLTVPPALVANLRVNHVLPEQVVLVRVRTEDVARVPGARRASVDDLGQGFVQVELAFGFAEQPDIPVALRNHVSPELGFVPEATAYVLGIERVLPSPKPGMIGWREQLFALLHRNAEPASLYFGLPTEQVIEIGQEVEL